MVLSANHLEKSFGERVILRDAALQVNDNDKIALIGANGVGKSTLLRVLVGEETYDGGDIVKGQGVDIGYLPQQLGYHSDKSIYEELFAVRSDLIESEREISELESAIAEADESSRDVLLAKYDRLREEFEREDGYAYKSRVLGVIHGLGFSGEAMHTCINNLSGGQKTRVALGKLLLTAPSLLILDEPTNHLDLNSVSWLENYLKGYDGALLVVSHDRYFIDKFASHIAELEGGVLRTFAGDYSSYVMQKEILQTTLRHSYEKQQAQIKHQEAVIEKLKSFNREKSVRRAESRQKMLDKLERIDKPVEETKEMHFSLQPYRQSGKDVLDTERLVKSFGDNHLFSGVSISVKRGERVAIIGDNGTGKTTLLRMINGAESIDVGTITLGAGVEVGYYDQEHGILHDEKTIFEEIQDDYPYLDNTEIRNTLAAFLFTGDDVFKPISMLSGGEKGRVSLAKLMLSEANLLLLDEPTNHLDIDSREILEDALIDYEGTVIYVSHDRYFIDRTATRILELKGEKFLNYGGNYSYYLEKKETVEANELGTKDGNPNSSKSHGSGLTEVDARSMSANKAKKSTASESKLDWKQQKEEEAAKRKLKRHYDEVEARIAEIEKEIDAIDEQLSDPAVGTDLPRLTDLTEKRSTLDGELADLMTEWETLAEQIMVEE